MKFCVSNFKKYATQTVLCLICATLLSVSTVSAQCVPFDTAISVMEEAINRAYKPISSSNSTFADCDPCKCPTSMSSCYAFMAEQERQEEDKMQWMRNTAEQMRKHGICNAPYGRDK